MDYKSADERMILEMRLALSRPLPGKRAHTPMSSINRKTLLNFPGLPEKARKSGVLILLFREKGKLCTMFIQRPQYEGIHSGQIAFPGGKMEKEDKSLIATALRETEEETGIAASGIEILGSLTEIYIPPSNFIVLPSVGYWPLPSSMHPDPKEVDEIITIPIDELLKPEAIQEREVFARGMKLRVPCYSVEGRIIWGATAMMISEFLELIREIPHFRDSTA